MLWALNNSWSNGFVKNYTPTRLWYLIMLPSIVKIESMKLLMQEDTRYCFCPGIHRISILLNMTLLPWKREENMPPKVQVLPKSLKAILKDIIPQFLFKTTIIAVIASCERCLVQRLSRMLATGKSSLIPISALVIWECYFRNQSIQWFIFRWYLHWKHYTFTNALCLSR